jgi:hypothetical protein
LAAARNAGECRIAKSRHLDDHSPILKQTIVGEPIGERPNLAALFLSSRRWM